MIHILDIGTSISDINVGVAWGGRREGKTIMLALSPDPAQKPETRRESPALPHGSREPVFASLIRDWNAGKLAGAAVAGCAPGIGWPLRAAS